MKTNDNLIRLKNAMEEIDRTWDFKPLVAILAEDVVFQATIREGTPISGQFTGKQAVTQYFTEILPSVAEFKQQVPMEFIAHMDRVIILGDDAYSLVKNNKTYRSPYAMIVTFREEQIRNILIIQDLSGIYEAYHNND